MWKGSRLLGLPQLLPVSLTKASIHVVGGSGRGTVPKPCPSWAALQALEEGVGLWVGKVEFSPTRGEVEFLHGVVRPSPGPEMMITFDAFSCF